MSTTPMKYGRIVAANDEWTLSDTGFNHASDTGTFASNVASWFTGGRAGRFLIYSNNFGLTQSKLHSALTGAGHTLVAKGDFSGPFTADNLASFDGVFLAGDAADNQALIDYVESGGCVYVAAGTGQGGATAEAARWDAFLGHFDLAFTGAYNQISGNQAIADEHPVFHGVSALYENNGNTLTLTDAGSKISQLVTDAQGRGLYAMTDLAARAGKIVAANDEWTLSDTGFGHASDTGTFAGNVAGWFTGGRAGRFLIYSGNFGLTQSKLHSALTDAGHTLVAKGDFSDPFTADNLSSFDGVFLAGDAADNKVLIDYVESGGCVYVAAGTGQGGATAEAARWDAFLGHFDLAFTGAYNQISGNQAISSDHQVFHGVSALYENNGNTLTLTDADSTISQLVTDAQGRGLYALTDVSNRAALSSTLSFQHVWSGSRYDLQGNMDLTAKGAPVGGATVSGLKDSSYTKWAFQLAEEGTDGWQASAGFGDLAGASVAIAGLFRTTSSEPSSAVLGFVGKRDASAPNSGWELGLDGKGRVLAMVSGDGNLCALNVDGDARDGAWHTFVLIYDKSKNHISLHTETASSVDPGAIPGDCTSEVEMSIGRNRLRTVGCELAFVAMAKGPSVESVDGAALAASLYQQYVTA